MLRRTWLMLLAAACVSPASWASDHSDVPQANGIVRNDANLTDLHAFVVGQNLVLAVSANAAIPKSAASYVFPTDVTFEINLDNHSEVVSDDPLGMGGTILAPGKIKADLTFRIRFKKDGQPKLEIQPHLLQDPHLDKAVKMFTGLRDDPFIRTPRKGRNIAAIVLEMPLSAVTSRQSMLLIWATSKVQEFEGPFQDLAGRSLRSMMPENLAMDSMRPKQHQKKLGVPADVMIYDTSLPAAFPNGRALTDDVVHLVGDPRVVNNPMDVDNDLPFLGTFPYLAAPHPPQ